jgi:hypothetical protein
MELGMIKANLSKKRRHKKRRNLLVMSKVSDNLRIDMKEVSKPMSLNLATTKIEGFSQIKEDFEMDSILDDNDVSSDNSSVSDTNSQKSENKSSHIDILINELRNQKEGGKRELINRKQSFKTYLENIFHYSMSSSAKKHKVSIEILP